MKTFAILFALLLALGMVSANSISQLDYVNIGDTSSESGHDINGWSDIWTWGGCYGGGDDGTLRTVLPRSPSCMTDDKTAYFSMGTNGQASMLELRHLLGSENDAYELYIKDGDSWTKLDVSSSIDKVCGACNSNECWYTDNYYFSARTGTVEFKIVALTVPASWCESWGLNAFSWARLNGVPGNEVPEFGTITALVALVGAVSGLVVLRKKL
jgi:hypothetical protein